MRNHTTGGVWAALTTGSELGAGWAADGPGGVRGPGDGAAVGPHVGSPGAPARCVWPLLARWTCRRGSDGAPGRAGPQVRYPTWPLGKRAKGPAGRRVPWAGPETPR